MARLYIPKIENFAEFVKFPKFFPENILRDGSAIALLSVA
jgi:hypothetical protein